ncbi:MAG: hypothetical protein WCQ95_05270 [Bacteroidota bacterium]
MKNTLVLLSVVLYFVLVSCSGRNSSKTSEEVPLEKGKVIAKVACKKDLTQSYALYLPSGYTEGKMFPLIIAFDAHGSGVKPVELFKEQAEKYGYILVGSNVSKNGMSWDQNSSHYDALLFDVCERFGIDKSRIYTCGFSGGSRVASTLAITKGGISGVIGCSAGLPPMKEAIKNKFDFFGYAGNEDMNYAEMVHLDMALEKSGIRHQLVVFNGTHEWPPKDYIFECIVWTELNAMKDKKKPIDKEFVKKQLADFDKQLAEFQKKGNKYNEYLLTKKIVNYFKDVADTKKYESELALLQQNSAVKNGLQQAEQLEKKEVMLQQQYAQKLSSENATWWKSEINRLTTFLKTSNDETEKHLVKRVMEYLSLAAFSTCTSLYNQGNLTEAEHYIELYTIIDTDNSEPEFMFAEVNARKKDADKTMLHLAKAAELGFNDKGRIDNDTIFLKYNQDKRFAEIMDRIKKNQAKNK